MVWPQKTFGVLRRGTCAFVDFAVTLVGAAGRNLHDFAFLRDACDEPDYQFSKGLAARTARVIFRILTRYLPHVDSALPGHRKSACFQFRLFLNAFTICGS